MKKNWSISQLKNYWGKIKHKLLSELMQCTGIEYHLGTGRIITPEHWWDAKIKENKKYAKYKNFDYSEIYNTYGKPLVPPTIRQSIPCSLQNYRSRVLTWTRTMTKMIEVTSCSLMIRE